MSNKKSKKMRLSREIKRAVIYIRFSSNAQISGYSVEYQLEQTKAYVKRKGYEFVKVYIDEAKTGKNSNRESLQQMISDADSDKFDIIVVFSFSRAFRNTRDALNTHFDLYEKYGVIIESVIEPIDMTSAHGKFSAINLFAMNELSSDITASHVRSSMIYIAKNGIYLGGIIPYGYTTIGTNEFIKGREQKKYAVNESEAAIVKEIYNMYLSGINSAGIRQSLLSRGIDLSSKRILKILHNRFYIGEAIYHFDGEEPIIVSGKHEAIIDEDTYNRVQIKFEKYDSRAPRKRLKYSYALTNKLYCGKCGGHMISSTSKDYNYYYCSNRRKSKSCDMVGVRQDSIEKAVLQQIEIHILNETSIKEIVSSINKLIDENKSYNNDLSKLKRKREQIKSSIKNTMKRENEGKISDEIAGELLNGYNFDLQEIDKKITSIELSNNNNISPEKIEAYLHSFLKGDTGLGTYERVLLFDTFVEKITVYEGNVTHIQLKFAPNLFKTSNGRAFVLLNKLIKVHLQ